MKENKKNNYTAPAVKVVAFQVEQGFAGSVTAGDKSLDQTPSPYYGTSEIQHDASTGSSDIWGTF